MKRIYTERAWNPELWGVQTDPERAAMRRVYLKCLRERKPPEANPGAQRRLVRR
jgi:hypothetical protein